MTRERKLDRRVGTCAYIGCENPLPPDPSMSHAYDVCDKCGLEDERADLGRRFPRPRLAPTVPEVVNVDLTAEGKAVAGILAALSALPDYSVRRVVKAVRDLVGDEDSGFTLLPNGKVAQLPLTGSDLEAVEAFDRLAAAQGIGYEDEDVP